jgi:hypothetical protein
VAGGEGKKLKIASLSIIERGSKPFIVLLCLLTSVEIYKYIKYIINHKEREREKRESGKNFQKISLHMMFKLVIQKISSMFS